MTVLIVILLLLLLLAVGGRRNHPGLSQLRGWSYAHRGLHGPGVPENSMAAFRAALEARYGVELDIHLTRDGGLAVIHDASLARTAGVDRKIGDLTMEQLKDFSLEGTAETIPDFRQVLALFAGKAPLIIELKADGGNWRELTDAAVAAMAGYEGPWCMESFDPRCVWRLRTAHPQVIRGQLTENFLGGKSRMHWVLKFLLTHNLLNFLTRPDFVAYCFAHRKASPTNLIWQKLWKVQGVAWTLRSREAYDRAVAEGWLPIFEGFRPEKP